MADHRILVCEYWEIRWRPKSGEVVRCCASNPTPVWIAGEDAFSTREEARLSLKLVRQEDRLKVQSQWAGRYSIVHVRRYKNVPA